MSVKPLLPVTVLFGFLGARKSTLCTWRHFNTAKIERGEIV